MNSVNAETIDIDDDTEIKDTGLTLSAGSKIFTNGGQPIYVTYVIPPGRMRWELKNPSNKIVYFIETDLHHGDGLHWIEDEEFYVPAFPQQGSWRVELWAFDPITKLAGKNWVTWKFNVGESSIMDSFTAPIYITYGGLPTVGWGAFSIALPSLFILSSPLWFIGLLFIALIIWKQSFKLAKKEFMNGLSEIKKRITFKKKKGGKKDVKKIKAKKVAG